MTNIRKLSRRSFLTQVAGGAAIGGGAMIALAQSAAAQRSVTDRDNGPITDPGGNGRGRRIARCTDNDSGTNSDRAGSGRGNGRTDRDAGARADPAGCGRR
jgi:hypothetical protein